MAAADSLDVQDVTRLLAAVTSAAAPSGDLEARRRWGLRAILDLVGADAGHWAWGRGNPLTSTVAPLAIIHQGYTPEQLTTMVEQALKPEAIQSFQIRAWKLLDGRKHLGLVRRDVIPDDEWQDSTLWSDYVQRLGFDSWAHAVNYSTEDTWSCLHMLRGRGREEFGQREALLAELALTGVAWLNARAEELVPPEAFVELTPRQRTVMLMLLDGWSRKEIASRLGISEDTVGDHLTGLYRRLGVSRVGELAARFLKIT